MWRNLKIRLKLLLGFGLLLLVFTGAVSVTWRYLTIVRSGEELSQSIVAVMQETSKLERNAYELLLAFRQAVREHTEENFSDVLAKGAVVQKDIDALLAFGTVNSTLQTPQYVREKVATAYKSYADAIDGTIDSIRKRAAIDSALAVQGQAIFKAADELMASHAKIAADSVKTLNASTIMEQFNRFVQSVNIVAELQTLRRDIQRAWFTNDFRTMTEALQKFPIPVLEKSLTELRNTSGNDERTDLMVQLIGALPKYMDDLRRFVQAQGVLEEQARRAASFEQVVNDEIANVSAMARNRVTEISLTNVADLAEVITILLLSTAISLALGILIAILISRSISNPLHTIVTLAKRAGEGDLTIERKEFDYEGRDELGELADVIAAMLLNQEESLQRVVHVADDLAVSAGNLSTIAEKTNASMHEVKTSVDRVAFLSENNGAALEECNAGVEEMSSGADTAAQSATDGASFISQTTRVSNDAIQTVNNVIAGMHNVNANSKETENKTRQLMASVENVSSFVSVITGIADQTNLLALNAAIEAARAGEVGRGFAVVAEEVRKLAEESARAAQSVNGIIQELQNDAQKSIDATTEAGRLLVETLAQAEQAQTELNAVLEKMNKASESIQNIAAVANEQAASSKEVAMAIDNATRSTIEMVESISSIRRVTDETTQSAEDVAEHSETMNEHSKALVEILSRFTLPDSPAGSLPGRV
jgi:methyl-accepting chemotaxis protein